MITISTESANALATNVASMVVGLYPILIIMIAVPLTFFVLRRVIMLIPK